MSERLAQRRLARAKKPSALDEQVVKQLAYVTEVSKNARTTWFGLIALILFCGVTLLDVQDRDFFEYGASTQLPLINVSVPTINSFWAAPLLVTGLYTYLHLYLDKLWKALKPLKNEIGKKPVTLVVYPWLISDTALEMRDTVQRGPYWFVTRFVTLCLCWLIGPVTMALFWIKSWAPHDEWLTTLIGLQLAWLCVVGLNSWVGMCRETPNDASTLGRVGRGWVAYFGALGAYLIFAMGWILTENGQLVGGLYRADLYRANFVQPDKDWKGRDAAWRTYQREYRKDVIAELIREHDLWRKSNPIDEEAREDEEELAIWFGAERSPPPLREEDIQARLKEEFEEDRREARVALERRDYREDDLRHANLREAFLAGLDLRGARLEAADLRNARLEGAILRSARLEGADLRRARLEGADLRSARLEGADLRRARLGGANLTKARLDGAKLRHATLDGADLTDARLDGADLGMAEMTDAVVQYASVMGATLSHVRNLTQEQLDQMYGDASTDLSGTGLRPPDHWSAVEIPRDQYQDCWDKWRLKWGASVLSLPKTNIECTAHVDNK